MCEGLGDKAIAKRLHISHKTIQSHCAAIYFKLEARHYSINTRVSAIAEAVARGMIRLSRVTLAVLLMGSMCDPHQSALRPGHGRPLVSRLVRRGE
jgi:hypothetical protein